MQTWKWLYTSSPPYSWRFVGNVLFRALLFFVVLNLIFVLINPIPALGRISAYNLLWRGRERLPYGENPKASYNMSLYQIEAMFASHVLASPKDADEYRVILIGDSSVWGILLKPQDTVAGQINRANYHTIDGRTIRAYNLGYPTMSLTKDLILLEYGLEYEPDLIIWLVTLESFEKQGQLDSALVNNNASIVRRLITTYHLDQSPDDHRLVGHSAWEKTIIGQRRTLADIFRLQLYGVAWSITGLDQEYPNDYTPRAIDLQADVTWHGFNEGELTSDALAFDVLAAGINMADTIPLLLVNEPIFISQGENSDIRYNFFYPQWAYDLYRDQLHLQSEANNWSLFDLWDSLPDANCYTDSAVHLAPACSARLGALIGEIILQTANDHSP